MLDVTSLLEEIKASPYEELEITAPHTGVVTFGSLKLGDKVIGPSGTWKERPGTLIATMMERAGCGHGSFIETEYEVIPGLVLCARGRPRQQP